MSELAHGPPGYRNPPPSSAVPLETMIEEMGGVSVIRIDERRWVAIPNSTMLFDPDDARPTVYEAVSALYAAWRGRE